MTTYTHPIFRPVRERRSLSVSAAASGDRRNLGEITINRAGLQFFPNSTRTGGADAALAVDGWMIERKHELLDLLAQTYDPTMRADSASLALIDAARAA